MFLISAMFLICALAAGPLMVLAVNPTGDFELGPGEYDGMPIPMAAKGSYDLVFTSDGPVTIYILTHSQYMAGAMSEEFSSYEERYEGVTSKTIRYDYGDSPSELMYVAVQNMDGEETVNVQIEIKVIQKIIDEQTGTPAGTLCGSSLLFAILVLAALASLAYMLRR